jgi:protein-disulfide isomerase
MKIKQSYIWWGLGAVVIVGLLFSNKLLNPAPTPATNAEAESILTIAQDDHMKGNPDAKVTLVEYLDFECEACGAYYPLIKQLGTEFPNDLRIVTRYFPLPGHKNNMTAAIAVEAASKQGKYWEMHDKLFETQETWGNKQVPNPQVFEQYAQEIGLDMAKFKADVADPSTKARVQRDFDASEKLGNTGTPSLFLQGKKSRTPVVTTRSNS